VKVQEWREAVKGLGDALIILLVGFAIFLLLGIPKFGNPLYQVRAMNSGSMSPLIEEGDLIVIFPWREPRPGTVVTLRVDGVEVTHRLLEIREDGSLRTKGDANQAADDWSANRVEVVGSYAFRIPRVGRITLWRRHVSSAAPTGGFFVVSVSGIEFSVSSAAEWPEQ